MDLCIFGAKVRIGQKLSTTRPKASRSSGSLLEKSTKEMAKFRNSGPKPVQGFIYPVQVSHEDLYRV